jgi:hypothetical protein
MPINRVGAAGIGSCTVAAQDIEDATLTNANFGPGSISNAQLANSSITVNGSSASLGSTLTLKEEIQWQAVQVADGSTQVVATAGNGYFLDTNAGVIEVFLPSSPTRGDVVAVVDYAGTFATNQCIVNTGGVNIDSTVGSEFKLTTNETIAYFVYVDSNKGWMVYLNQAAGTTPSSGIEGFGGYDTEPFIAATGGTVTTSGDFKIHTFTGDGCFVVSNTGLGTPTNPSTVDYLVVAGGGGTPTGDYSGGGGAGGFRESTGNSGCYTASPLATPTGVTVAVTTYPVTVGAGGGVGAPPGTAASDGSNSVFSTITSTGGGHGGTHPPAPPQSGGPGGSGGGGGYTVHALSPGGSGNTPPTSPPQGNNGGLGHAQPSAFGANGGGGGGAGAAGQAATLPGQAGQGGDGVGTAINPSPCVGTPGPSGPLRYFAGGGGGAQHSSPSPSPRPGGVGGGGAGNTSEFESPVNGTAGTANTGGGAGAKNAAGGKGIVIIRYKFQ